MLLVCRVGTATSCTPIDSSLINRMLICNWHVTFILVNLHDHAQHAATCICTCPHTPHLVNAHLSSYNHKFQRLYQPLLNMVDDPCPQTETIHPHYPDKRCLIKTLAPDSTLLSWRGSSQSCYQTGGHAKTSNQTIFKKPITVKPKQWQRK